MPETVRGDEAEIERLYEVFSAHYKEHCADTTKPYEGICALLRQLKEAKIKTAVVSNKADFGVQELCARYFPGLFDVAIGEQPGLAKKPAPDMVGQVLSRLAAAPKEAVYIGDSEVDIATAKNAAMDGVIVSWGFRDPAVLKEQGAKVIVSSVPELQALLLTHMTAEVRDGSRKIWIHTRAVHGHMMAKRGYHLGHGACSGRGISCKRTDPNVLLGPVT